MALIINKTLTTKQGLKIPSLYIRLIPTLSEDSKYIKVEAREYISKTHFQNGFLPLESMFFKDRVYSYNSELEGLELLPLANAKFKNDLVTNNTDIILTDEEVTVDGEILETWDGSWKEPDFEKRIIIPLKDVIEKYYDKVSYLKTVCPYYYINRGRIIELYLHQIFPEDEAILLADTNVYLENRP